MSSRRQSVSFSKLCFKLSPGQRRLVAHSVGVQRQRDRHLALDPPSECQVQILVRRTGRCASKSLFGAGLRPIFEPGVVAAVNLDQLADARSAAARLVNLRGTLATWLPKACGNHLPSNHLQPECDAVVLDELLARQRRSEVAVAISNRLQWRARLDRPAPHGCSACPA